MSRLIRFTGSDCTEERLCGHTGSCAFPCIKNQSITNSNYLISSEPDPEYQQYPYTLPTCQQPTDTSNTCGSTTEKRNNNQHVFILMGFGILILILLIVAFMFGKMSKQVM